MGLLNKIYSILDSIDFSIDNGEINIYFKIAKEYNIAIKIKKRLIVNE